MNSNVHREFLE